MAIPDYQTIMFPLLRFAGDKNEHSLRETIDNLAGVFDLTEEEQDEMLPSGQQEVFKNRVAWARTYLKKAGLLHSTRRGYFIITDRGVSVLDDNPKKIDVHYLEQFKEFQEFRALRHKKEGSEVVQAAEADEATPEETLETAYQRLRDDLASELLAMIMEMSPSLFEKLVVELLLKMGYGGSRKDAGRAIGRSGDEGIDGIIKEDRLGLDIIYIQAKRWQQSVGRPEVQKFAGALQGQRARKGIMITTSEFTREAKDFSSNIDTKIVLIDGRDLAQYMIDFNLGVSPVAQYEVKRVDTDYFIEE